MTTPEAKQTATALSARFAATLPPVEGRKRHTAGRAPATFQSIFRLATRDDPDNTPSKVGKTSETASPTTSSAADGHSRPAVEPLRQALVRSYTEPDVEFVRSIKKET